MLRRFAAPRLAAALLALLLVFSASAGDGRGARLRPVPERPADRYERDPNTGREWTEQERFEHLPRDVQLRIADEVLRPLYARYPQGYRRAEPFIEDLPYLRVRLPNNDRSYDALLKEEVRLRFERALKAELISFGISVFTFDFSTSPAVEAEAQASFRRQIPARDRRWQRSFGRLLGERPDAAAIRRALTPFSGRVLILVGHVDRDSRRMTWTRGRRKIDVDLDLWAEIAADVGVGLIPYGCYSAEAAPIGSPYAVNSAQVARGIGKMLAAAPRSYGAMFAELTRERNLTLDLDPFHAALSFDRMDIMGPDGAEGEIWWHERALFYGMIGNPGSANAPASAADLAQCGAAGDMMAPGQCMDAAQRARDTAAEASASAVDAANVLGEARQALTDAERARWASIALFAASLVASALLLGLKARLRAEAGAKPAWRALLPRYARGLAIPYGLALALALPGWAPATIAGWGVEILLGVSVVGALLNGLAENNAGEIEREWPALLAVALACLAYLPLLGATAAVAESRDGLAAAQRGLNEACREVPARLAQIARACGGTAAGRPG